MMDMFFLPFGVFPGEPLDPAKLTEEFQRANRVAENQTQHQWAPNTFDQDDLRRGDFVKPMLIEQAARLYRDPYNGGTYNVAGNDPDLHRTADGGAGDDDLWQFPYNRGLQNVFDKDGNTLSLSWTSQYPEMVIALVNYQFIRYRKDGFAQDDQLPLEIRAQLRIFIDDSPIPGSGPYAQPIDGKYRGTGFARRSGVSALFGFTMLPAGNHTVILKGGQAPAQVVVDPKTTPPVEYLDNPPTKGVCLGHRKLAVFRFPRSLPLEG